MFNEQFSIFKELNFSIICLSSIPQRKSLFFFSLLIQKILEESEEPPIPTTIRVSEKMSAYLPHFLFLLNNLKRDSGGIEGEIYHLFFDRLFIASNTLFFKFSSHLTFFKENQDSSFVFPNLIPRKEGILFPLRRFLTCLPVFIFVASRAIFLHSLYKSEIILDFTSRTD